MGKYRKFDPDFKQGAVRLVLETGKPIAQVARELGVHEGTLGNWVAKDRAQRGHGDGALTESECAELVRLRKENAELRMQRDVLKRSVALWVDEAMGPEHGRGDHARAGFGGPVHPPPAEPDPAGSGTVARSGSGRAEIRCGADQPQLVRRWHRNRHR